MVNSRVESLEKEFVMTKQQVGVPLKHWSVMVVSLSRVGFQLTNFEAMVSHP